MIKNFFLIIVCGLITCAKSNAQGSLQEKRDPVISVAEAIEKNMVELNIYGAFVPNLFYDIDQEGMYFGKCMEMTIKSKIDTPVIIKLDCGTLLYPRDTLVQTMVVTHDVIIPLLKHSKYITRFYAMCSEIHDYSPSKDIIFKVGKLGDEGLVKLARLIEESFMQNIVGQSAVWAYCNHASIEDVKLYGADSVSLIRTKEILDALNLATPLNTKEDTVTSNKKVDEKAETEIEVSTITLNQYFVYGGLGLILILSVVVIFFLVRKRKQ